MKLKEIISDGTPTGLTVGIIHVVLIIAAYLSPFWISWQIVIAGVLLLWFQFLVFGGCLLNKPQYGEDFAASGNGLYEKILTQFGVRYSKKRLKTWLDWIIPLIVLVVALIWQIILKISPAVKI